MSANSETKKESKAISRLLTIKEASKLVEGLTEYRVRQMCINDVIEYHKFGNKYMIAENSLLNFFGMSA